MAKFVNKKERTYDFKLTPYGHYLFSVGSFKPEYYGFYDDNVVYDSVYTTSGQPTAVYTHVETTPADVTHETLILEDATGKTHTMTFNDGAGATSAFTIRIGGFSNTTEYAAEVAIATNLAYAGGFISITAGQNDQHVILTMTATGSAGVGKTVTGTAFTDGSATVTAFKFNTEPQNKIHSRIKNDTQYLGTQVVFEDIDKGGNTFVTDGTDERNFFEIDITPTMQIPRADSYRIEGMLGDARLEGNTQKAPAWKLVTLDGTIKSSSQTDTLNNINIPQINIELNYFKKVEPYDMIGSIEEEDYRNILASTYEFSDGNVIKLVSEDLMLYAEELNTVLLTENFDIEVFKILEGAIPATNPTTGTPDPANSEVATDLFQRKYFEMDTERIAGGILGGEAYINSITTDLSELTSSVAYYFDIHKDYEINEDIACKGAEIYNRDSYYIDLDFECDSEASDPVFNDIYGPVTEPEICL